MVAVGGAYSLDILEYSQKIEEIDKKRKSPQTIFITKVYEGAFYLNPQKESE